MIPNALPQSLADNPRLDQWIAFEPNRVVALKTGKVEIGQGILTALRQIAAEELDLEPARLRLVAGDTELSPDEGYTAGSLSVEISGAAIRLVCAEVRARMIAGAAVRLGLPADRLNVADGSFLHEGRATGLDYWSVAGLVDLGVQATGSAPVKRPSEYRIVGRSEPRLDLPDKVFGAPFVHDLEWPGMVHARILHRPWTGAHLAGSDAVLAQVAGPGVEVVRDGDFVAFVSPDETATAAALGRAWERLSWEGGQRLEAEHEEAAWLASQPTRDRRIGPDIAPSLAAAFRVKARYSRPYLAHGSIGPSCAVARFAAGRIEVWTHSQGVVPLKTSLARVLRLPPESVALHHRQGAGCYGHNGADDVALDAALGVRVRDLPLTRDRVMTAMSAEVGS